MLKIVHREVEAYVNDGDQEGFQNERREVRRHFPMKTAIGVALCIALGLATLGTPRLAQEAVVPDWFKSDPDKPYAIFDAWRKLSTTEAALYLGPRWSCFAGVLQDKTGKPIGNCPLAIYYDAIIRSHFSVLTTDSNGYFVIYSPYGGVPLELDRLTLSAAPGYPFVHMAMDFASQKGDFKKCDVRVVAASDDRCYGVLTCSEAGHFDQDGFDKFIEQELANSKKRAEIKYRRRAQTREGTTGRGVRNQYKVKITSPDGAGIADAVVMYSAYDDFEGNSQTVLTDAEGTCTLLEELLGGRKPAYYDGVRRTLTLDVPSYAVGPVTPLKLRNDGVNVITAQAGAAISGKVLDWNGNPFRQRLTVRYKNPNSCSFELDAYPDPHGNFTIQRIMPGEPFRLWVSNGSHQSTPSPEVWSDTFTLKSGEVKEDIVLKVPQAAAVRGIVVDEQNKPVKGIWLLQFHNREGGWGHGEPEDAKFGTYAAAPLPLQVKINAKGFEPYLSKDLRLKPGELHFIKVVMKRCID